MSERYHQGQVTSFNRYNKTLKVEGGTAVVFSNSIPHRFNTIYSHDGAKRLFVNFFIVDPAAPLLTTTANTASPGQIRVVLRQHGISDPNLVKLVSDFCGGYSQGDLIHRTVLRDQARAAMSAGRQHWKTQYFGNAGTLQFFPDARWNPNFDRPFTGFEG